MAATLCAEMLRCRLRDETVLHTIDAAVSASRRCRSSNLSRDETTAALMATANSEQRAVEVAAPDRSKWPRGGDGSFVV